MVLGFQRAWVSLTSCCYKAAMLHELVTEHLQNEMVGLGTFY